jgi:predicted ATP-dependent protease
MLRGDVVEAAAQGKFHIYAVSTIDEGFEVLTGVPAGERDGAGRYPPDSVNGLVEKKLEEYSERLKRASEKPNGKRREEGGQD